MENYVIEIYSTKCIPPYIYYFNGMGEDNSYYSTYNIEDARELTKEKAFELAEKIKDLYKINPNNGTFDKISVINVETLKILKIVYWPKISRFQLMDI